MQRLIAVGCSQNYVYKVTVHTGSVQNAGTTARVGIIMYGTHGNSGFVQLRSTDADAFCAGAAHAFVLEGLDNLGEIDLLRIGHDGSGSAPDWYVERIVIEGGGSKGADERRWCFECHAWFSSRYADGKTLRDLVPVPSDVAAPRDSTNLRLQSLDLAA